MKRLVLAGIVALSFATHVVAQVRIIRGKPDAEANRQPVFIAADAIFTESGQLAPDVPEFWGEMIRSDVARSNSLRRTSRVISANAAGQPCGGLYLAESDIESPVIRDSAKTTVENAKAIISGRIRTITPGFFHASPASLLELDQLTHVKTSVPFRHIQERLYIRHPFANFQAGGSAFCREARTDAAVPEVGDRVLVFAFADPFDDDTFIYSHLNDLILESKRTGHLHVPALLDVIAVGTNTIDAVTGKLKKLLQQDRGIPERGR